MEQTEPVDVGVDPEIPLESAEDLAAETDAAFDAIAQDAEEQYADEMAPTETVEHLAKCMECGHAVRYMPRGAGFVLAEHSETSYGIGPNGRPVCPHGHGEMAMADEQIPATDAITSVAERLEPQQASLPGIVPPFNYQGAYLELEEKAVEVDRLHAEYKDAAQEAREAKQRWDKAAELYTKMALELRRRRKEKVAAGEAVTDVDPTRCTFEQLHPDTPCPICGDPAFGGAAPRDSAEHANQADEVLVLRDVVAVEEALEDALLFIPRDTIRAWTDEQRAAVKAYAIGSFEQSEPLPARPDVLGTNHVAGPESETAQACTQCDAVLVSANDDGEFPTTYPEGALVGTECPGRPVKEPDHHYTPKRSKNAPKVKAAKKGRGKK